MTSRGDWLCLLHYRPRIVIPYWWIGSASSHRQLRRLACVLHMTFRGDRLRLLHYGPRSIMPCLCLLRLFVVTWQLQDEASWGYAMFPCGLLSPRPPSSLSTPSSMPRWAFWSDRLSAGILLHSPTVRALARLRTTLFMVAVPSGLRSSQHLERLRHPSWLVVSAVGLRELLATSPRFLAKIEQMGLSLAPSTIPAWMFAGSHLPLYPVGALRMCVKGASRRAPSRLFFWHVTLPTLSRLRLYRVL